MTLQRLKMVLAAAALGVSTTAIAQTPFAGEDFDGGTTNGGFTATTMVFTPDNSGSTPNRGTFRNGGSIFDRFGEVSTADSLPFGVVDESLDSFPGDRAGFVPETKTDDFVLSVDLENGDNPSGTATAEWTFDISGRSNIGLSIDMGMLGDFGTDDTYDFVYSIDGGPTASAFAITAKVGEFYTFSMDDGTEFDRFTSPFFREDDWQDVVDNGPTPGVFEYHPRDNGMDDDLVANDGFVPVTFGGGQEEVRAYRSPPFDQEEFEPAKDPLAVTSGDGTLVEEMISPEGFETYSTALEGTGSTLTLTLNAVSNGGDQYFAFDNIVLTEEEDTGIFGDFEPDGDVDITDFGLFADAFGSMTGDPNYDVRADSEPDGDVDITDFGIFADYFGTGVPTTAIPEPTSLAILAIAAGLCTARRNR